MSVTGKTFPAFPEHAQPASLRIWQEAHRTDVNNTRLCVWLYHDKMLQESTVCKTMINDTTNAIQGGLNIPGLQMRNWQLHNENNF